MATTDINGVPDPQDGERLTGLSDDTIIQNPEDAHGDELDDLEELEELQEEVIEEWLDIAAALQSQIIHFQEEGKTQQEINRLRNERAVLQHLKAALGLVEEVTDNESAAENEVVARWLLKNLVAIRKHMSVLAARVKQATTIGEQTRRELLEQYREIHAALGRLERHPEQAPSLIAKLRHFMIRIQKCAYQVEEVMRVWIPLAHILLPRLLPGV